MAKPSGEHSAKKKGDNGKVDPKASGQTTQPEGPLTGSNGAGGDNSGIAVVSHG